jgi:hypothetical protein
LIGDYIVKTCGGAQVNSFRRERAGVPLIVPHRQINDKPYTNSMNIALEDTSTEKLTTNAGMPKYAHYAESVSVTEGYVMGKPVLAVCGELFIPSRDPKKFPVCPICKEIVEALFLDKE